MSRLPQQLHPPADSQLAEVYRDICHTLARTTPPNLFTAMSARPDIAGPTWKLMHLLLANGQIPGSVKQLMVMAISSQANCRYCMISHTRALEAMGITNQVIEQCTSDPVGSSLSKLHSAIISFARKAARDPNSITDADVSALNALGLDRSEIIEVAITVALTRFINTWADATGIEVDPAG
ncbi:MAG: carboxymuconolactone decarboxylase family protein [Proteobacteria bacterium]|nr:carboxymuconolactone decarboxylase family protein [Pseudomonadota bacterium]